MLPEICADQDVFCKDVMLATLRANGVHMHPGCRVEGIEAEGVRAYDMAAEKEILLPADTVILAGGLRSNAEDAFQDPCRNLHSALCGTLFVNKTGSIPAAGPCCDL